MTRIPIATACVLALGATAGTAIAVAPVKRATYRGALAAPKDTIKLSFKVSANGKQVTKLATTDSPVYCQAGGGLIPQKFKTVAITKKGTFKAVAQTFITEGPSKGKSQVKVTIAGRFAKGRKAKGTLTADWFGADKACDGKSAFTASA